MRGWGGVSPKPRFTLFVGSPLLVGWGFIFEREWDAGLLVLSRQGAPLLLDLYIRYVINSPSVSEREQGGMAARGRNSNNILTLTKVSKNGYHYWILTM